MFRFKNFNKQIINFLVISIFVTTLVVSPTIMGLEINASNSPSLGLSVRATAAEIEGTIAQAPPTSQKTETAPQKSEGQKEVIDFFGMAMGAIAGLVLFIYGVTRLAEGLEEISTDIALFLSVKI